MRGALAAAAVSCLLLAFPARAEDKALHGLALVIGQSDYASLGRLSKKRKK